MIISITGKSGSGKTYIAQKLAKYFDAKILSFDDISHQALEDDDIKDKIKTQFGDFLFENNYKKQTLGYLNTKLR